MDLWNNLGAARRRLANLLVAGPRGDSPPGYRSQVDRARDEMEMMERTWASQSAPFRREQRRDRIDLSQVARSIPERAALVAYAVAGDSATRGYVAFILRPPSRPVAVPLGRATVVDEEVARWLADMSREAAHTKLGAPATSGSRVSGASLRRVLWDPLVPYVKDAPRVFFVPEGAIHLVNLAALPVGHDGYLVESGAVFHYLTAERDLVPDDVVPEHGAGLLAIGNPAYGKSGGTGGTSSYARARGQVSHFSAAGCVDFDSLRFHALPGSGREVEDIARLWGQRGETITLVGSRATEEEFKSRAPGRDVLHIATHGFFLGKCSAGVAGTRGIGGMASSLVAVRNRKPSPGHPLLLAGLALAGANHRSSVGPNQEDGILTAEEIAGVNLSGVRWAVLSACDTGNGQVIAGEGILGLQRAFQVAGARTVIMSLWAVDDDATRSWMDALYDGRIVRNLDTATAVAEASLHVLRERKAQARSINPFYWAGFVAVGDWR
jgi:CHAT domain-containing protein